MLNCSFLLLYISILSETDLNFENEILKNLQETNCLVAMEIPTKRPP